jgi:deoxyribodipyrimidine photolyase-related protein
MDGTQPAGGRWNYDVDNRKAFASAGPGMPPTPVAFPPDPITAEVFNWSSGIFRIIPAACTVSTGRSHQRRRAALDDFIGHRLPLFGDYQDAMWAGSPWLDHSRLSAALNLKLIDPMSVCRAAEATWRN